MQAEIRLPLQCHQRNSEAAEKHLENFASGELPRQSLFSLENFKMSLL